MVIRRKRTGIQRSLSNSFDSSHSLFSLLVSLFRITKKDYTHVMQESQGKKRAIGNFAVSGVVLWDWIGGEIRIRLVDSGDRGEYKWGADR